jgi:hypothetical protein
MPERPYHVLIRDGHWVVVKNGDEVPTSVHDRKQDAVRAARDMARKAGSTIFVFTLDGRPDPRYYE